MARVRTNQTAAPIAADALQTLVNRIAAGTVLPIVGSSLSHDLALGGHDALPAAYVTYCQNHDFTLAPGTLAEMMQFRSIADDGLPDLRFLKEDYVNFAKNRLFDTAEPALTADIRAEADASFDSASFAALSDMLSFPRFDQRTNPFLLLASLNLPIYLTTSGHSFLEMALRQAGRDPQTEICRWRPGTEARIPPVLAGGYEPSKQKPLVYHLYGLDEDPNSLVLTEDDYLNYLVAVTENFGNEHDPVHKRIRLALAESSLLLLGYSLRDWETRTLFRGLIVPRHRLIADDPASGVVSIQLKPDAIEERYLNRYLQKYKLEVEWRSAGEYLADLQSRL